MLVSEAFGIWERCCMLQGAGLWSVGQRGRGARGESDGGGPGHGEEVGCLELQANLDDVERCNRASRQKPSYSPRCPMLPFRHLAPSPPTAPSATALRATLVPLVSLSSSFSSTQAGHTDSHHVINASHRWLTSLEVSRGPEECQIGRLEFHTFSFTWNVEFEGLVEGNGSSYIVDSSQLRL